jgi:ribosome-binding factor A
MHPYKRAQRVGELLKEVVAGIVHDEIKDLPGDLVTIVDVRLSEDLGTAHVYYTVLGGAAEKDAVRQRLKQSAASVRSLVGRRIRLKYLPEIDFRYDDGFDTARRIDQILDHLKDEERPDRQP